MAEPMKLTPGVYQKSTPEQIQERKEVLRATIQKYLPQVPKSIQDALANHDDDENATILLHQDAFAAGFDTDEYILLGMAIKYAGLYGINIQIIGNAGETC